ncbi:NAD(+) synthase [Aquirufa sp. HETE-83D]|uniref:Glutamine-dependent NAD(+) synthetase n=1 Tax=Aquirufa esocilacus TaxID=3096513 RepID=A0ABW6DH09_9BACT
MKQTVVFSAGALNQLPLDWSGNRQRILEAIAQATSDGAALLCLPELCISGYGCEDQFLAPFTAVKSWESLELIASKVPEMVVVVGLALPFEGNLYNVSAILSNGKIQALIPKQFLADDGVHYEPRWFKPWPRGHRKMYKGIPLGDYRVHFAGITLGIEICQDAWEGEKRPAYDLACRGVSVICNPTASHFAFGKAEIRKTLCLEGARIINGVYLFANLLGNEAGRIIFDGDAYIVHQGSILAQTPRFSFQDFTLVSHEMTVDTREESGEDVVSFEIHLPEAHVVKTSEVPAWESSETKKEEEFSHAVSLGLFDYLRKSRSQGWVLSLSGGADSSAIASLCALSVQYGIDELGWEGMKKKLSYIPLTTPDKAMSDLLTTIYQGTVNSSQNTRDSARELAEWIGSTHYVIEIDLIVQGYRELVENAIGRSLTWEQDDITLQNVQARVRAPSAWMLANIKNALLLATSNRSEASVGYATMDGDTSGSISPISGIDKSFIRTWLLWLEAQGFIGLQLVNSLEPSAELRPLSEKQVDEEDLMPYPILNTIERLAFYDLLSPHECLEAVNARYGSVFAKEKLEEFVRRFFRLWARNQWKRERYAPGFHVDDYSLDPKSWLRFPILSAGLEKDI